ncbi:hypothetical protein DL95DRAFT_413852 [Leptodontidium sp. 2 PMI_412]|nr:hypothetical protein DL95DRAFT_413852 [Leptodontidium sp. 2 PMI_412]
MGKRSQRKKQLRAQRKRREKKSLEVHLALTPIIARQDQPKPLNLLTIPLEIRFKIFSAIAHGTHTITIAPGRHIYSPLTGLIHSHLQLENEIAEWRKCYTRPAIHLVFGEFNPALTTFKITFRSKPRKVTRVYEPAEAQKKILTLELWKRAMDMAETNKQFVVNQVISYLAEKLWKWKPEMGWKKHTPEFRLMQEQLEFLLFDESHAFFPIMDAPLDYEEPLDGDKPMPDVKPGMVYRKVYQSSDELGRYYRSLGLDVRDSVRGMERVHGCWVMEDRRKADERFARHASKTYYTRLSGSLPDRGSLISAVMENGRMTYSWSPFYEPEHYTVSISRFLDLCR